MSEHDDPCIMNMFISNLYRNISCRTREQRVFFRSLSYCGIMYVRLTNMLCSWGKIGYYFLFNKGGQLAEWLRHWTLNHEIVGLSPAERLVFCT